MADGLDVIEKGGEHDVEEKRELSLTLPRWMWKFLQSRADYHHNGNLSVAASEMVHVAAEHVFDVCLQSSHEIPEKGSWS